MKNITDVEFRKHSPGFWSLHGTSKKGRAWLKRHVDGELSPVLGGIPVEGNQLAEDIFHGARAARLRVDVYDRGRTVNVERCARCGGKGWFYVGDSEGEETCEACGGSGKKTSSITDVTTEKFKPKTKLASVFQEMWRTSDEHRLRQLERSWFMITRDEQKSRLRAVTKLVLELEKICQVNIFLTGFAESLIERVIEGDWDDVSAYRDDLAAGVKDTPRDAHLRELWEGFLLAVDVAVQEAKRTYGLRRGGN